MTMCLGQGVPHPLIATKHNIRTIPLGIFIFKLANFRILTRTNFNEALHLPFHYHCGCSIFDTG